MYEPESYLQALQRKHAANWPNLVSARERASAKRGELRNALAGKDSEDTSIVVFGSLARDEFTNGSDIDWTLLIDGFADTQHLNLAKNIREIVKTCSEKDPGPEATFGSMAWSHSLVHLIGGEDDTNRNTTQRILMLLESTVVGRREAYDRVRNHILDRYILEDSRFVSKDAKYRVPRFLLNDFARYWRTMAVDFAYKRRTRDQKGIAIRNIKLRMSRKLIYVSGLLACFGCHLELGVEERNALFDDADAKRQATVFFRDTLQRTPLEILSGVLLRYPHLHPTASSILNAYDAFLGVLADDDNRKRLEALLPAQQDDDPIYQHLRQISHRFRDGVLDLFFDVESGLFELTKVYGVF
ncbi:MAG TPA: nucleotidyltransferase domain-containing protein [Bryobacteraceae bacterium]|nr:nucleotidyltransferase domain-containing protein [Bryobacteraceae bacterium]